MIFLKIVLGLIFIMLANICLKASIAKIKKEFEKEKLKKYLQKALLIVFAISLMYFASYLNPDIVVASIGGIDVNLLKGMELLFVAGILNNGYQCLVSLKEIIKLTIDIESKEKKEIDNITVDEVESKEEVENNIES